MRFRFGRKTKVFRMPNQMMYVASDGSYGDATNLVLVDTSEWSQDDWDELDGALDTDRVELAISITTTKKGK